ncbi:MAG TPA: FUSC family protein [Burkholderiales bacterium]|nr:FUSC family protein [Burkholderiales bacterium]
MQLSLRVALAAMLALVFARLLHLQHPLYAMIAAVIVTDLSTAETHKLGLRRIAGTVLGGALGALLSLLLPSGVWAIGAGIFGAMFLSHVLRLPEAARVSAYTCAIVLLEHGDGPWFYAFYRTAETLLGIVIAILVSYVPKLFRTGEHR